MLDEAWSIVRTCCLRRDAFNNVTASGQDAWQACGERTHMEEIMTLLPQILPLRRSSFTSVQGKERGVYHRNTTFQNRRHKHRITTEGSDFSGDEGLLMQCTKNHAEISAIDTRAAVLSAGVKTNDAPATPESSEAFETTEGRRKSREEKVKFGGDGSAYINSGDFKPSATDVKRDNTMNEPDKTSWSWNEVMRASVDSPRLRGSRFSNVYDDNVTSGEDLTRQRNDTRKTRGVFPLPSHTGIADLNLSFTSISRAASHVAAFVPGIASMLPFDLHNTDANGAECHVYGEDNADGAEPLVSERCAIGPEAGEGNAASFEKMSLERASSQHRLGGARVTFSGVVPGVEVSAVPDRHNIKHVILGDTEYQRRRPTVKNLRIATFCLLGSPAANSSNLSFSTRRFDSLPTGLTVTDVASSVGILIVSGDCVGKKKHWDDTLLEAVKTTASAATEAPHGSTQQQRLLREHVLIRQLLQQQKKLFVLPSSLNDTQQAFACRARNLRICGIVGGVGFNAQAAADFVAARLLKEILKRFRLRTVSQRVEGISRKLIDAFDAVAGTLRNFVAEQRKRHLDNFGAVGCTRQNVGRDIEGLFRGTSDDGSSDSRRVVDFDSMSSGCVACVCVYDEIKRRLYVCNVGDINAVLALPLAGHHASTRGALTRSRIMPTDGHGLVPGGLVGTKRAVEERLDFVGDAIPLYNAVRLSREHTTIDLKEFQRIRDSGVFFTGGNVPFSPESKRSSAEIGNSEFFLCPCLLTPPLRSTRALGLWGAEQFGICATPDVAETGIRDVEKITFVVMASNCFWEVMSTQEAVDIVANNFRSQLLRTSQQKHKHNRAQSVYQRHLRSRKLNHQVELKLGNKSSRFRKLATRDRNSSSGIDTQTADGEPSVKRTANIPVDIAERIRAKVSRDDGTPSTNCGVASDSNAHMRVQPNTPPNTSYDMLEACIVLRQRFLHEWELRRPGEPQPDLAVIVFALGHLDEVYRRSLSSIKDSGNVSQQMNNRVKQTADIPPKPWHLSDASDSSSFISDINTSSDSSGGVESERS